MTTRPVSTERTSTAAAGATPPGGGPSPALELRGVRKALGGRPVVDGLDLVVARGELVCILGPSGCGKTTTLRMVAGFVTPDEGRILISGADVTAVDAQHRPTAMVFQNYALWPHMTVLRNVTFGLRARGATRADATSKARAVLELVGLERHASRLPAALSGGEQQRVALARALALDPELLLMDEPLSNLDAQLRLRVREELVELQQRTGVTMILVTHDQDEALSIADRVAVMHEGVLDQVDPPAVVYRDAATSFVAGFVGRVNIVPGHLRAGVLRLADAEGAVDAGALAIGRGAIGPAGGYEAARDVEVAVRPEEVELWQRDEERPSIVLEGTVSRYVSRGHFDEVVVDTAAGQIRAYVAAGDAYDGPVRLGFRRMLVYCDGILAGALDGTVAPTSARAAGTRVRR